MQYQKIEIDEEVFDFLKRKAEPFVDTPNSVLRRLLLNKNVSQAEPLQVTAKQEPETEAFPRGTPVALQHILEVIRLVKDGSYSRNSATNFVARKHKVASQTVQDKYGRQLGLTANDFDRLLSQPQSDEMITLLVKKFPSHGDLIRNYLGK